MTRPPQTPITPAKAGTPPSGDSESIEPSDLQPIARPASGAPEGRVSVLAVNRAISQDRGLLVVDVRSAEDYARGHVPGALHLPREKWASGEGLSKEKVNVVYCYSHACHLGGEACALLAGTGYPVVEMDGGFEIWQMSDLETER